MTDLLTPNSERCIAVSSDGSATVLSGREFEAMLGLTQEMSFATDILYDAGMLDAKRLSLLQAAEDSGRDVAGFARHLVRLSKALVNP